MQGERTVGHSHEQFAIGMYPVRGNEEILSSQTVVLTLLAQLWCLVGREAVNDWRLVSVDY